MNRTSRRRLCLWWILIPLLCNVLAGCSSIPGTQAPDPDVAASSVERDLAPEVPAADLAALVDGGVAFAFDLYHALRGSGENVFLSPLSVSYALAMTSAGARTRTLDQMEEVLRFPLDQAALHPAFNALDLELATRAELPEDDAGDGFALILVNSTWAQKDYPFLQPFLDTLGENYGAGVRLVDYRADPETARVAINGWVSDQTEGKIEELLPEGMVTADDRLTLVNAVYFLAPWAFPFDERLTVDAPFHLMDGSTVDVPTMQQTESFAYAQGDGYQAIELPYNGNQLAMTIILPAPGRFEEIEASLSPWFLANLVAAFRPQLIHLALPRFSFEWEEELSETLSAMGMTDAFTPAAADFSGMDGTRELVIGYVMHKAFVSVHEEGTEAAAATAVGMRMTAAPGTPIDLRVNRAFVFLLRDLETGALLFLGRVMDPA